MGHATSDSDMQISTALWTSVSVAALVIGVGVVYALTSSAGFSREFTPVAAPINPQSSLSSDPSSSSSSSYPLPLLHCRDMRAAP